MALKLSKCRLCLKLGEFYSIFTVDNAMQLAEMAMDCARIKIRDGDGLPDKICSQCIEQLSASYLFKQQCERSDTELRKNLPPDKSQMVNRQSSDSGFSNNTDTTNKRDSVVKSTETSKAGSLKSEDSYDANIRKRPRSKLKTPPSSTTPTPFRESLHSTNSDGPKRRISERSTKGKKKPRLDSDYEDNSFDNATMESDDNFSLENYDNDRGDSDSSEAFQKNRLECKVCNKVFNSSVGLSNHIRTHTSAQVSKGMPLRMNKSINESDVNSSLPSSDQENTSDSKEDGNKLFNCSGCNKQFKLQIMLKRHNCSKTTANSAEEADEYSNEQSKSEDTADICPICKMKFKTKDYLKKHMRLIHAAKLQGSPEVPLKSGELIKKQYEKKFKPTDVPVAPASPASPASEYMDDSNCESLKCLFCPKMSNNYLMYLMHYGMCDKRKPITVWPCPKCNYLKYTTKNSFNLHIKKKHFKPIEDDPDYLQEAVRTPPANFNNYTDQMDDPLEDRNDEFECKICSDKFPTQDELVKHLTSHVSKQERKPELIPVLKLSPVKIPINRPVIVPANTTSAKSNKMDITGREQLQCQFCDKPFLYRKSLASHIAIYHKKEDSSMLVKHNPPPVDDTGEPAMPFANESQLSAEETESEDGTTDNTCDICDKIFSYRKALILHKRKKHNISSGFKRTDVVIKECTAKCLICDVEMTMEVSLEHNKAHIERKEKPRNEYSCTGCNFLTKNHSDLRTHIKMVHRLKKQGPKGLDMSQMDQGLDMSNFCEVVVANLKSEPEEIPFVGHNDSVTSFDIKMPAVSMGGFTCTVCNKTMNSLRALTYHMNWHAGRGKEMQKTYECTICKQIFRFNVHYKLHMREHWHDTNLDPKLLTCEVCGRRSKHLRAHTAHLNWHKQARFRTKDYQCSICKKMFQYRKYYLLHMTLHLKKGETIERPSDGEEAPPPVPGEHRCTDCGKVLPSEDSLKCHTAWHRSKTALYGSRYECGKCGKQFTNKKRHELHERSHFEDPDGAFKCQECGKGYIEEKYLLSHMRAHRIWQSDKHKERLQKLRESKVKCPICEKYYPDLTKLIGHLKRTHPGCKMLRKQDPDAPAPARHSCKLCAKDFPTADTLARHEERHTRKHKFFKCKWCGIKNVSLQRHNLHVKNFHLTQKFKNEPLKCSHCEEVFDSGYGLHNHLRDVHEINETWIEEGPNPNDNGPLHELQCVLCKKVLASKGNYSRHLDYHNTLRCNYCFEYFKAKQFLEGHIEFNCEKRKLIGNTDVYEKKLKCIECFKPFSLEIKLNCHRRIAHGVQAPERVFQSKKELVCDYCFSVFQDEECLASHKIYHRTIGYYGCIYCPRKFNTVTLYNKHKNHHFNLQFQDDPIKCDHCEERFVYFREYIYHMRDEHGDEKDWIVMPKEVPIEYCEMCKKDFFNLPRHMAYHEKNRCNKCSEYFFSASAYDAHLCPIESDVEEGGNKKRKDYYYEECAFCFKSYRNFAYKASHNDLHARSYDISCRFCPEKFRTMESFNWHSFSHRTKKYRKRPLKCRVCKEKFIQYGPFIRHLKSAHRIVEKMHYRGVVAKEKCVVCNGEFPNLHNHYRHHLQMQCQQCFRYICSQKLFDSHDCEKDETDNIKIFESDADLKKLTAEYKVKEEFYPNKHYNENEEEEDEEVIEEPPKKKPPIKKPPALKRKSKDNVIVNIPEGSYVNDFDHQPFEPVISDTVSLSDQLLNLTSDMPIDEGLLDKEATPTVRVTEIDQDISVIEQEPVIVTNELIEIVDSD